MPDAAGLAMIPLTDRDLIALQGPTAKSALVRLNRELGAIALMDVRDVTLAGASCIIPEPE